MAKQYIDKSAIVAEIKKRIDMDNERAASYSSSSEHDYLCRVKENVYKDLLSFLDTLEMKEKNSIWKNTRTTVPEDSTNQIICIKEDGLAVSTVGKIVNGTIKWAYLDDLLNTNSFNVEVREVDLEKEIDNYIDTMEAWER
jgi:hypothetical protein